MPVTYSKHATVIILSIFITILSISIIFLSFNNSPIISSCSSSDDVSGLDNEFCYDSILDYNFINDVLCCLNY